MSQICLMLRSKSPSVLGLVNISPATSPWEQSSRKWSRSVRPSLVERIVLTEKPERCADAGLVPWAESGISIVRRPDDDATSSASSIARLYILPIFLTFATAAGSKYKQ